MPSRWAATDHLDPTGPRPDRGMPSRWAATDHLDPAAAPARPRGGGARHTCSVEAADDRHLLGVDAEHGLLLRLGRQDGRDVVAQGVLDGGVVTGPLAHVPAVLE